MSGAAASLPSGFEALEPFVAFWAVDSAAQRAHCRDVSDEASRAAFYDAAIGLIARALEYLDARPLGRFDASEQRLMRLALSFAHVSMAVELQRDQEPRHARDRPYMRITRAPADQPAG